MKKIIQILCVVSACVLLAMSSPNTSSKYASNSDVPMSIIVQNQLDYYTYATAGGTLVTFKPSYSGYYAILARGADAGRSYKQGGNTVGDRIDGADGGCMLGYCYLDANSTLLFAISSSGTDSNYVKSGDKATPGTGGSNPVSKFSGGDGSVETGSVGSWILSRDYSNDASGGAGGATVVYKGTTTTDSNIIMIAGGGGASPSLDTGYDIGTPLGVGGNGGSNFGSLATNSAGNVTTPVTGTVYAGINGTAPTSGDGRIRYGTGGTISPGTGGDDNTDKLDGNPGSSFANGGTGGKSGGMGGPGGGGYAGGGGGAAVNWDNSAGGGGGGSSFIASSVKPLPLSIATYMCGKANYVLTTPQSSTNGTNSISNAISGYVIILYLGNSESAIDAL